VWNHAVFSKNRERLLNAEIARRFFCRVLDQAQGYLSDEHFTVDGTLMRPGPARKAFRRMTVAMTMVQTFTVNSAVMIRTGRRPIRARSYTGRVLDKRPG